MKPETIDYPPYYSNYIHLISADNVLDGLREQQPELENTLNLINDEVSLSRYAPGKWTIREVTQHISDAERVFSYRALCIARGETISLPSFDQDIYNLNSNANSRSWSDIHSEILHIRAATTALFHSFSEEILNKKGLVNGNEINVNSLGYIILGHAIHHIKVIKDKYLI